MSQFFQTQVCPGSPAMNPEYTANATQSGALDVTSTNDSNLVVNFIPNRSFSYVFINGGSKALYKNMPVEINQADANYLIGIGWGSA
jgi:hypothetical protein